VRIFLMLLVNSMSLLSSQSYAEDIDFKNSNLSDDQLIGISIFSASAASIDNRCGSPKNDGGLPSEMASAIALLTASAAIEKNPDIRGSVTLLLAKAQTAEFDCAESKNFRATIGNIVNKSINDVNKVSNNINSTSNLRSDFISTRDFNAVPNKNTNQDAEKINDSHHLTNKTAISRIEKIMSIPRPEIKGIKNVTLEVVGSSFSSKKGKLAGAAIYNFTGTFERNRSYFAILGSFDSKTGAMRHLKDLRNRRVGFEGVVYPPRIHQGYWTVVAASFASYDEANAEVIEARRTHLASDAYVWSAWRNNKRLNNVPFMHFEKSVPAHFWPDFLTKKSSDPRDSYFVSIARTIDQSSAATKQNELRAKYPTVPMLTFGPLEEDQNWRIMIAAHATLKSYSQIWCIENQAAFCF
ncbi:MAG: hypothetical protein ABL927_13270, partial [Bdellovibrionales bacterium]